MAIPPTCKEIFMNTALLAPFISIALSGVGVYTHYYFKKYQASMDQCQKVHKMMVDTLLGTKRLFSRSAPAQALKSELRIMQQQLSQEAQKLDKMTIRLPLKRLQREQRHILRHADWLLHYLDSHLADNEGKFFLFLHDLAMDSDDKVLDFLTSLHDTKRFRNRRLQTGSTTSP
ncbi:hypothetical protein [Salmonella enterica]|uniref:hypothetical protein n=1 Tax=Salmonella enterica TaxID=28901 RepID=UPI00142B35F6|nr:hypothetical protein [Salmonella enterica]EDQ4851717.1 hypothetical protein [Salmonella enterica subsp. enterica serovar Saintpaul]ECO3314769.1 hypothetical protein [Salmonella enterica subsp. enterica serovar Typhimurium]EDM5777007.1 hypothetical protein [Salmonella enterica subsp. enterica serovar Typhimurium]EDO5244821.1 hypothetical protein [Salmonella enterica]EIM1183611.1 hypothetical protein [Salmonella enterica]